MNDIKESEYILVAEDIHKNFEGLVALDGASVSVKKGGLIALIGPNGSGKTTLFNVITGWTAKTEPRNPEREGIPSDVVVQEGGIDRFARHKEVSASHSGKGIKQTETGFGQVLFDDEKIDDLFAHEIALKGMLRTFQTTRNWPRLTVLENLLVAPFYQTGERILNVFFRRRRIKEQERKNILKAIEILSFLEIAHIRDQLAQELSGGQLKLLALGRLLMNQPKLILLDEPLAGVNPTLGNRIMDKIIEMKKDSTIFLIEHDMKVVFNYSDEIFVMARGKVIAHGTPNEIENNREVIEAYLGADY